MPYRRITYIEQCWYVIMFKLRELLRKKEEKDDDRA